LTSCSDSIVSQDSGELITFAVYVGAALRGRPSWGNWLPDFARRAATEGCPYI